MIVFDLRSMSHKPNILTLLVVILAKKVTKNRVNHHMNFNFNFNSQPITLSKNHYRPQNIVISGR